MLYHSRPEHLRIPQPGQKSSQSSPTTDSEVSSAPAASDETVVAAIDVPAAIDAPAGVTDTFTHTDNAVGSALDAWGSSDATVIPAAPPRVGKRASSSPKTQATKNRSGAKPKTAKTQPSARPKSQDAHPNRESHRDTRILVIENDIEAADHVIQILESDGYAVEIATDANYGAVLAQTFLPHLILLGAISEQLSGADFMRSLRNTPGFAERSQVTPVLYLIDNSQLIQQRFQGLRDTPLTSTIFKPANEHELLQKIERALSPQADFPADTL